MAALICGIFINGSAAADTKTLMLQVLGSGGPELSEKRAFTFYLLSLASKVRQSLDTGPGSRLHFEAREADFNDSDAVLFSHFHVDHSPGLPVYIKTGCFSLGVSRVGNATVSEIPSGLITYYIS